MIIDGFTFYNEVDLLEMRFEELYPVVDRFVMVDSFQTFRGRGNPGYFKVGDDRWAPYRDKITHVTTSFNGLTDPWEREKHQRNMIGNIARATFSLDDILILSDVDEIPSRELVAEIGRYEATGIVRIYTDLFYYALNVCAGDWGGVRYFPISELNNRTANEIRQDFDPQVYVRGGWHFSYLGDNEFISNKFRSFSHSELDLPEVHKSLARNRASLLDPFNHGETLTLVEIDDTWPEAVKNNREFWRKYEWQSD